MLVSQQFRDKCRALLEANIAMAEEFRLLSKELVQLEELIFDHQMMMRGLDDVISHLEILATNNPGT